jgi:hypothetical protein
MLLMLSKAITTIALSGMRKMFMIDARLSSGIISDPAAPGVRCMLHVAPLHACALVVGSARLGSARTLPVVEAEMLLSFSCGGGEAWSSGRVARRGAEAAVAVAWS